MNELQVILDEAGRPAFAVIPWREYERLSNGEAEALMSDESLYDHARAEGGESFPAGVVDRLLAGENPVRAYRSHRGMTQGELAAAGVHPVYISQIETGKRTGSAKTLAAIAGALGVAVDDLI